MKLDTHDLISMFSSRWFKTGMTGVSSRMGLLVLCAVLMPIEEVDAQRFRRERNEGRHEAGEEREERHVPEHTLPELPSAEQIRNEVGSISRSVRRPFERLGRESFSELLKTLDDVENASRDRGEDLKSPQQVAAARLGELNRVGDAIEKFLSYPRTDAQQESMAALVARINERREAVVGPYNDQPGGLTTVEDAFARGRANSVDLLEREGKQFVFKPEKKNEENQPSAAREAGIDPRDPKYGARNIATRVLAKAFDLDLIPDSRFAVHNDRTGVLMDKVEGQPARKGSWVAVNENNEQDMTLIRQAEQWRNERRDDWDTNLKENGIRNRDGSYEKFDPFVAVDLPCIDYKNSRDLACQFAGEMNKLEWLDLICGQLDRNPENFLVQVEGGNVRVQGIDNDISFGDRQYWADGFRGTGGGEFAPQGGGQFPAYIDGEFRKKLLSLDFSQIEGQLHDLLTPDEIAATEYRLEQLKAHARSIESSHTVEDWVNWPYQTAEEKNTFGKLHSIADTLVKHDQRSYFKSVFRLWDGEAVRAPYEPQEEENQDPDLAQLEERAQDAALTRAERKEGAARANRDGRLAMSEGRFEDAVASFMLAVRFDEHPLLQLNLSKAQLAAGNEQAARYSALAAVLSPRANDKSWASARRMMSRLGGFSAEGGSASGGYDGVNDPLDDSASESSSEELDDATKAEFTHNNAVMSFHAARDPQEFAEIAQRFEDAFRLDPQPRYALWAGMALEKSGNLGRAEAWMQYVAAQEDAYLFDKWLATDHLAAISELRRQTADAIAAAANRAIDEGEVVGEYFGAAKLLQEAYNIDPHAARAYLAALSFQKRGDEEREIGMLRRVIHAPDADQKGPLVELAIQRLGELGVAEEPKYPATRTVGESYTRTPEPSPLAFEETTQKHPIWDRLRPYVTLLLDPNLAGRARQTQTRNFKRNAERILGREVDINQLIVEGAIQILGKTENIAQRQSTAEIQQHLRAIGINNARLSGEAIDLATPMLDQINSLTCTYLKSTEERAPFQLDVDNADAGGLSWGGNRFDTSDLSTVHSGKGWAIYVMTPDGKLFSNSHVLSSFHHSSFLGGGEVAGAGEIQATNGVVTRISNKTGHYQAGPAHLAQTLRQLREMGQDLGNISIDLGGVLQNDTYGSREWRGTAEDFLNTFENDRLAFQQQYVALGFADLPIF